MMSYIARGTAGGSSSKRLANAQAPWGIGTLAGRQPACLTSLNTEVSSDRLMPSAASFRFPGWWIDRIWTPGSRSKSHIANALSCGAGLAPEVNTDFVAIESVKHTA